MKKDFLEFEKIVGLSFENKNLLRQAFIHRSYLNENPEEGLEHNERLEFLGDAVLELVITEFLFAKYPATPEGELTAFRAALVNTNSLSESAHAVGMEDFLLLSKGEEKSTGKARSYILANAFEALLGALYLDGGYEKAKKLIEKTLFPKIEIIIKNNLWQDAKSRFQEKSQEKRGVTPSYRVLHEEGPDHEKKFTVGVFIGEELIAEGVGHSKQESEQTAAQLGLEKMGWMS
jgi:ribonuclease-3